jgi:hypothetical protein
VVADQKVSEFAGILAVADLDPGGAPGMREVGIDVRPALVAVVLM